MVSAPASALQKNFGEWHDRLSEGPVEITHYGRTTAYLVSAKLFRQMWASFRTALPIEALSDEEMAMIAKSEVMTDQPYTLDDIPELDLDPSMAPGR